jgi:hypothetical protein
VRAAVSTAVILRNFSNMTRLPRVSFGVNPHFVWLPTNSDVKKGASLAKLEESMHPIALISRYGESEDRRAPQQAQPGCDARYTVEQEFNYDMAADDAGACHWAAPCAERLG